MTFEEYTEKFATQKLASSDIQPKDLLEQIQYKYITAFYKKRKDYPNRGVRIIEVGQGKVVMLSSFIYDDLNLPEYYYKDKHDNYHLYEHSKELEELVTKYIEVNG